jgi:hypothetical protein
MSASATHGFGGYSSTSTATLRISRSRAARGFPSRPRPCA